MLNGALCHEGGHGCIGIFRDHVTTVHETARHLFHRQRMLKDRHDDLGHRQLLMTRFHGVKARVRDHVRLKLSDVDVHGHLNSADAPHGGDDVHEQAVQVGVRCGARCPHCGTCLTRPRCPFQ